MPRCPYRRNRIVKVLQSTDKPLSASEIAKKAGGRFFTPFEVAHMIQKLIDVHGESIEIIERVGKYGERKYKYIYTTAQQ